MRPLLALASLVLAAVLALVQLASSAAYGDLAARPSLPAYLHAVDPRMLSPFLGGPFARAQAALHQGDLDGAERLLKRLPDDARTADLRGQIAQARGGRDEALAAFVRAGDVVRAQGLIDAVAATDAPRAIDAERGLLATIGDDPNASEVTGQAWWRLGQLQALAGYLEPARRAAFWGDAERSYERALTYAPNEETYLLAAGYQSLANGDLAGARRRYARAAQVVPDSADAYGGLASAAAMRHDCAAARADAARSRALRHDGRDLTQDPLFGPALRACGVAAR
jgi:tetratricopeptide (TPR) repeat protein